MERPEVEAVRRKIESEQNLARACAAGLAAAVAGALLWAAVGLATGYEVRFMAVAVGYLVGYTVRLAGKGISQPFGVVGLAATVFGCALGNLLTVAAVISGEQGLSVLRILSELDYALAIELMMAFYQPLDAVFYAFATYQGYRLSFRQLSEAELTLLLAKQHPSG